MVLVHPQEIQWRDSRYISRPRCAAGVCVGAPQNGVAKNMDHGGWNPDGFGWILLCFDVQEDAGGGV